MAVTPSDTNQAFLREVDEELRREQLADVWSRFGRWIIVGIVAALAAFGGVLWWRAHQEGARGVEGEQLQSAYDALAEARTDTASVALVPLADSKAAGYRALARMSQADILTQKKDLAGAARLFASIAADDGVAQPLRDLALVRQTATEFDALKPDVVVGRLRALAVRGNPWFAGAGELVALAYLKMNRRDLAATLYGQIASADGAPDSLRQRAVQMASILAASSAPQPGGSPQHEDKPAT